MLSANVSSLKYVISSVVYGLTKIRDVTNTDIMVFDKWITLFFSIK